MKFSPYIWGLYKNSTEGKKTIDLYATLDVAKVETLFGANKREIDLSQDDVKILEDSEIEIPRSNILSLSITQSFAWDFGRLDIADIDSATAEYERAIEEFWLGTRNKHGEFIGLAPFGQDASGNDWYEFIEDVSFGLYCAHPEFYLPYRFKTEFDRLQRIAEIFNMPLTEAPSKRDTQGRQRYHAQINYALYEFRQLYNLTPAEMCAFLYDFAVKATQAESSQALPEPLKAWLLIGNPANFEMLDQADKESDYFWSGNINSRPGDICVMYCKSPRSYVHSIWRATSEGFNDPFFHYQNSVRIGSPIHTQRVTFKEMHEDAFLGQTSLIRARLQGASGKALSVEEYEAILRLMQQKGQNITILPKLKRRSLSDDVTLNDERDVEEKLLEPLLLQLGYTASDWTRQMPVRMGRGERVYPDCH